jgi:hypothetical protein
MAAASLYPLPGVSDAVPFASPVLSRERRGRLCIGGAPPRALYLRLPGEGARYVLRSDVPELSLGLNRVAGRLFDIVASRMRVDNAPPTAWFALSRVVKAWSTPAAFDAFIDAERQCDFCQ